MKSKETFEIDKYVRLTILNGLKYFEDIFTSKLHWRARFYKDNFNQFWIKGHTEFLKKYFKYFAGAHESKNYHKNRRSLVKF